MADKTISRRGFLGTAGAAAGTAIVGCDAERPGDDERNPAGGKADDADVGDGPIVRAVIHPGIGVARLGDSPTDVLIGPEVDTPEIRRAGESRDLHGRLKRQAARFRIYGFNANGQIVRELTSDESTEIEWTVHLANKKASWYRFLHALDIPEAAETRAPRRNPGAADRSRLEIDPGPRSIAGRDASGQVFDTGRFKDVTVTIGELRTDEAGRLLVLSGRGRAESPSNAPIFDPEEIDTFNNADDWFDDTGDGPVDARVKVDGVEIPVEGAWVIVAPPNYAPDVIGWRTLYDLLVDTYVEAGMMSMPDSTSFTHDVLPALRRMTNLQWVNKGFADAFGAGAALDFDDPEMIARLAGRTGDTDFRRAMFSEFRPEVAPDTDREPWPWIYGDAFGSFDDSPRVNLGVSGVRAVHLMRWLEDEFDDDFDPDAEPPRTIEEVPLGRQPAMLDKAALHFCLADAFHPGCELTWPVRHASMYSAPFRIRRRSGPEPDLGDVLTAQNVRAEDGPLTGQAPGDLTRWMALPWQGDTVFCRSGYDPEFDPFMPTFWPARVPNHVLTAEEYNIVMNRNLPRAQRLEAFAMRRHWVRFMVGDAPQQMHQMIREFGRMGVVEARPGPGDDPAFPELIYVESLAGPSFQPQAAELPPSPRSEPIDDELDPVLQAGWESDEQLQEFRRILGLS